MPRELYAGGFDDMSFTFSNTMNDVDVWPRSYRRMTSQAIFSDFMPPPYRCQSATADATQSHALLPLGTNSAQCNAYNKPNPRRFLGGDGTAQMALYCVSGHLYTVYFDSNLGDLVVRPSNTLTKQPIVPGTNSERQRLWMTTTELGRQNSHRPKSVLYAE